MWRYAQGGSWINLGFLIYVSMDMNLENGLEIQNAAFRQLWVMMHIGVLNSERNEEEQEYDEDNFFYGTTVLK